MLQPTRPTDIRSCFPGSALFPVQWGAAYRLAGNHEEQQAALKVPLSAHAVHLVLYGMSKKFVHARFYTQACYVNTVNYSVEMLNGLLPAAFDIGLSRSLQSEVSRTGRDLPGKPCSIPQHRPSTTAEAVWRSHDTAFSKAGSGCELPASHACSSTWSGGRSSTTRGTAPTSSAGTPRPPRWCGVR